jgi:hypothetical protein
MEEYGRIWCCMEHYEAIWSKWDNIEHIFGAIWNILL